jgi:CelD/BcsL family acetyltransferase involved in cellulose biosynthesis
MSAAIQVEGEGGAEALLALQETFTQAHVRWSAIQRVVRPGQLDPVTDAVAVVVAPDVARDLAEVLAAWLRLRTDGITLTITRPDGTRFETTVAAVRALGPDDEKVLIRHLSRALVVPHPHLPEAPERPRTP